MRRALCFPFLLATLITIPAAAQQPPAKKGAFATVIKQATGKNGYEELVMAGDLLESCRRWKQVEAEPNASLTTKRAVLAEPQVVQALRLLRAGLLKPVGSPREAATFDTLLPELAPFRSLGRLLALQQYVFCADGRISDALGNARLSLRLGQVIQTDTLISGLVGVAVSAICIQQLGAHLDQLSARDTEVLHAICLEWLRQPNPEARLMESERRTVAASLDDLRGQGADRLISALNLDPKPRPDDDDAIRRSRQLAAELRTLGDAAALDRVFDDLRMRLDDHYAPTLEQFRLPLWKRQQPASPDDGSLAGGLAAALVPTFTGVGTAYAREQARVRLLACHAAVLRYRWEHNQVPRTLAELRLGELATDPFTGQPLEYEGTGRRYRLVSVGPEAPADDPKAIGGRVPVSIVPGD